MAELPTFTALNAEISGHLFENPSAGVPRGVYWSCNIDFAPIVRQGEDEGADERWPCTLLCDWIAWPVHNWRKISGLTLESCVGPVAVEASLYFLNQHQWLSEIELSFQHSHDDRFRVRGRFAADLEDLEGNILKGTRAQFDLEARFVGLSVLPDNLFPKPETEEQAMEALGRFADLQAYERPLRKQRSWIFMPRICHTDG
jgi:hypothetical protein